VLAMIGCVVAAATGSVSWWIALVAIAAVTVAIDVGAMLQRFYVRPAPLRWLAATAANLPLITTYLASRTFYSPRLLLKRRSARH
jgi:hypothetical protein